MKRHLVQRVLLAIGCLAATAVLWFHLDDLGGSDFIGGRVTGPIFQMADVGSLLLIIAMLLPFIIPRIAATICLAAATLCLPIYLYFLMPGPYRWIFRGEYHTPIYAPLRWNNWAVLGVVSLVLVAILSARTFFSLKAAK
jgi:hypothetical protein